MCVVCGILLYWHCLVGCRRGDLWPVEKEGLAQRGIVRDLACLLGGGIGCGISRRGLTCSCV